MRSVDDPMECASWPLSSPWCQDPSFLVLLPTRSSNSSRFCFSAFHKSIYPIQSSKDTRILPRTIRAASVAPARKLRRAIRRPANHDLLPDLHDPLALQQLRRARPPPRILFETPLEEFHSLGAELVLAGQLRRVSLSDIVHDCPLVVERCPRSAAGAHLKDDAAEGPNVNGALSAFILAFDDFRRHVHGGAGHGFLFPGDPGGAGGRVVGLKGFALARDDFGRAEVDVFDHAIVVEENV